MSELVRFNVGGKKYTTTLTTIMSRGSTNFLARLVENHRSGKLKTMVDEDGHLFIDRDGRLFALILNFLRTGEIVQHSKAFELEMQFYCIDYPNSNGSLSTTSTSTNPFSNSIENGVGLHLTISIFEEFSALTPFEFESLAQFERDLLISFTRYECAGTHPTAESITILLTLLKRFKFNRSDKFKRFVLKVFTLARWNRSEVHTETLGLYKYISFGNLIGFIEMERNLCVWRPLQDNLRTPVLTKGGFELFYVTVISREDFLIEL